MVLRTSVISLRCVKTKKEYEWELWKKEEGEEKEMLDGKEEKKREKDCLCDLTR